MLSCNILVTNLFNVEETTLGTDIRVLKIIHTIHNGSANSTCNTIVVSLAHTTNGSDISLDKVVLSQIYRFPTNISNG